MSEKKKDYERLIEAIEEGNSSKLTSLLEEGLNPNDHEPRHLIREAWSTEDFGGADFPAEYSEPGPRPLDVALKKEDPIAVAILLKNGAEASNPIKITEFRQQLENKKFFADLLARQRS